MDVPASPCDIDRKTATALVSVVTVVFNDRQGIARTIESVLAQDYPHLEYIVIDGGSTDDTLEIVTGFGDAISRVVSGRDRGVYDGMNRAVATATGEYILFMNSGDVFSSPDALSRLMSQSAPGREQVLFGGWTRRSPDGRHTDCRPDLRCGSFNHQAVAYSRSIHSWHGGYAVVPGLTTADYLFFATLFASPRVELRTVDALVATIDTQGISAGPQTFAQKWAIDFLRGSVSQPRLALALLLHPIYTLFKRWLRWTR